MRLTNLRVRQELAMLANERRNKVYYEHWESRNQWLFKPQIGLTDFRILHNPYNEDGKFFTPVLLHYAVAVKETLLSLRPDKVIDYCDTQIDSKDKAKRKIARDIRPQFNYFAPILVRGQEDVGVQLLRLTEVQHAEFQRSVGQNIDWQINDYQSGRDVTMRKTSKGYCSFSLHEYISPLTDDELVLSQAQLPFPHPSSLYREPSPGELDTLLINYINESNNKHKRTY